MPQSMAAGLLLVLGVAPACADCFNARQALVSARHASDLAVLEETAASERHIAARSEADAARLRRERENRRAGRAARERAEAFDVCRFLDDDRGAVLACEGAAGAAYERALAAQRHAQDAARQADLGRNSAWSALTRAEEAVSRAMDALRAARGRVRRECGS